jgi:hypothetical protein
MQYRKYSITDGIFIVKTIFGKPAHLGRKIVAGTVKNQKKARNISRGRAIENRQSCDRAEGDVKETAQWKL